MPMLHPQIDAEAGAASDGGRRPTVVAAPPSASPELSGRPRRRAFTARDTLRILAAVVPIEDVEALEAAEDAEDAAACSMAMAEYERSCAAWLRCTPAELAARWGVAPASDAAE